jgi:molybdopterin molybdotransferase
MISVEDAHRRIVAAFAPLPTETVSVAESSGRVLAQPVIARLSQPPADLSAMDGYAVRAADVSAVPTALRVVGSAPAGGAYPGVLRAGEAVRIFTGGPVPAGADAIVIQEDTKRDGDAVTVLEVPTAGRHIRRAGLDFAPGAIGIAAPRRLTPRDAALAAGMNVPWLAVHRRPRVAVLATGDELVLPGEPVEANQIVASSLWAIVAMVRGWGAEALPLGIARDEVGLIGERLAEAAKADVLVTLGGASVGDHDLIRQALGAQGFALDFWRIAMRPGKPLMFAERANSGGKVLGLPGNPVSSLVCALLFLKPAIERMLGLPGDMVATVSAELAVDVGPNDTRQDYVRSALETNGFGAMRVRPFPVQDSSMMSVLARADALLVRPAHDPARRAGERVDVIRLDGSQAGI